MNTSDISNSVANSSLPKVPKAPQNLSIIYVAPSRSMIGNLLVPVLAQMQQHFKFLPPPVILTPSNTAMQHALQGFPPNSTVDASTQTGLEIQGQLLLVPLL